MTHDSGLEGDPKESSVAHLPPLESLPPAQRAIVIDFHARVALWLGAGFCVTGLALRLTPALLELTMYPDEIEALAYPRLGLFLFDAMLLLWLALKMRTAALSRVKAGYLTFALVNGVLASNVLENGNGLRHAIPLIAAGLLFGASAVFGLTTSKNLSDMIRRGALLYYSLVAVFIVICGIGFFLASLHLFSFLTVIMSFGWLLVFCGFAARDAQLMRRHAYQAAGADSMADPSIVPSPVRSAARLYLYPLAIAAQLLAVAKNLDQALKPKE